MFWKNKLEVPHQVEFLDEALVHANGSEPEINSDGSSQSVRKRGQATRLRCINLHAWTQNGFVSRARFIFVSGTVRRFPWFDEWVELRTSDVN